MTHAASMAEIRHAWYGVPVPMWAPVMIGVSLLLVLTAFLINPNRKRAKA